MSTRMAHRRPPAAVPVPGTPRRSISARVAAGAVIACIALVVALPMVVFLLPTASHSTLKASR